MVSPVTIHHPVVLAKRAATVDHITGGVADHGRQLAREAKDGMGGPFIPFFSSKKKQVRDPRFTRMLNALARMEAMDATKSR